MFPRSVWPGAMGGVHPAVLSLRAGLTLEDGQVITDWQTDKDPFRLLFASRGLLDSVVRLMQESLDKTGDWKTGFRDPRVRLTTWDQIVWAQLILDRFALLMLGLDHEGWRELPPVVSRRRPIARP